MSRGALKAFLLAAGLGTRLKPVTGDLPKCLVPIGGKPLLGTWLDHLSRHGIDEVLINTHWRHEKVEVFLQGYAADRPRVRTTHEPELLGSAGTLWANREWVAESEQFLILYADNLTDMDLTGMIEFHRRHGYPFTLGVFRTSEPSRCGIAEVDAEGVVVGFEEKPKRPRSDLAAAGIYIAEPSLFGSFPDGAGTGGGALDLGFHVIPRLTGRMKAYLIEDFLLDIGTPESYREAQALWMARSGL